MFLFIYLYIYVIPLPNICFRWIYIVSFEEAPDYDQIIKRRMDLSTIKKNLQEGVSDQTSLDQIIYLTVPNVTLYLFFIHSSRRLQQPKTFIEI